MALEYREAFAYMNQQRIQSYVDLIQKLLVCPKGEEWILLRQNEALVTPELVQVMEQVASQLTSWGNPKEATFLHNLAGQIHHLFVSKIDQLTDSEDNSQVYLEFIQTLLDSPSGSEDKLLAANKKLIGPGLVHRMQQVSAQSAANGDQETANYLQHWAMQLNRAWLQQHNFKAILKKDPGAKHPDYPLDVAQFIPPPIQIHPPSPAPQPSLSVPTEDKEDFWAEQPDSSASSPLPSPENPQAEPVKPSSVEELAPAESLPYLAIYEQINRYLETIAEALTKRSAPLAPPVQPPTDPLWYMEALERAYAGNWMLTSGEIERLIGVKPNCPKGSESFQRGSWLFVKAGKVGTQTGWRVKKENEERSP